MKIPRRITRRRAAIVSGTAAVLMATVLPTGAGAAGTVTGESALVSNNAFLRHNYAEVGARPNGSFGSVADPPAGWHPRGGRTNLGFVSDREKNGWGTGIDDGDFFLPGSPFEAWGLSVTPSGGSTSTTYNHDTRNGVTGQFATPDTSKSQVTWASTSPYASVGVSQTYSLPSDGASTLGVDVTLTNTSVSSVNVVYMRAVDADNCKDRDNMSEASLSTCRGKYFAADWWGPGNAAYYDHYGTVNKIESQRASGDSTTAVSSSQDDGSQIVLWSTDPDSKVFAAAPDLADPSMNSYYGSFCKEPQKLQALYDIPQTYTPSVAYNHASGSSCGQYYNKPGESFFLDELVYMLIAKTIPAGGNVTFSLSYSLSSTSYQESAGLSTTTTAAPTTTAAATTTTPATTVPAVVTTVAAVQAVTTTSAPVANVSRKSSATRNTATLPSTGVDLRTFLVAAFALLALGAAMPDRRKLGRRSHAGTVTSG